MIQSNSVYINHVSLAVYCNFFLPIYLKLYHHPEYFVRLSLHIVIQAKCYWCLVSVSQPAAGPTFVPITLPHCDVSTHDIIPWFSLSGGLWVVTL